MIQNPLTPELLCMAYAEGYFPMPDPQSGKILWFNPEPRAVLPLESFHCPRSLSKTLRRSDFRITFDEAFDDVMKGCADRSETWITDEFFKAYGAMARLGHAHSIEVWGGETLVGGLYGVSLGGAFFAESKFHRVTDASKVALYHLVEHLRQRHFSLLEVQFLTPHLARLGAIEIPSKRYLKLLNIALQERAFF